MIKNRVLLIEDDKPVLDTLKEILEQKGFHVTCISDAAGAHEQIDSFTKPKKFDSVMHFEENSNLAPDWIIMDYEISGLNTIHYLDQIREAYPKSKIIISSGYPETEIEKELELSTFEKFVSKPFNPMDLIRNLN